MKSGAKRGNKIYLTDPDRKFIEMRPIQAIYEYGRWETDFIVSKFNSRVLLVCAEKYSKIIRLALLPDRTAETVKEAFARLLKGYAVRRIREFIPKKTDLKSVDSGFVSDIEDYFNHKPRVCLEGRTAYEVSFSKEIGGYGIVVESLSINFPDVRIWG